MKEKQIENQIRKALTDRGFWVVKIHGGIYQMSGLPDLLAIRDGRAYWFEVKTPTGKVSRLQEEIIKELRSIGCTAEVVRSREEAVSYVETKM